MFDFEEVFQFKLLIDFFEYQNFILEGFEYEVVYFDFWNLMSESDGQIVDVVIMLVVWYVVVILGKYYYIGYRCCIVLLEVVF